MGARYQANKPDYMAKRQYLLHLLTDKPNPKGRVVQRWNRLPKKYRTLGRQGMHNYLERELPQKWSVYGGMKIYRTTERNSDPNSGTCTSRDCPRKA